VSVGVFSHNHEAYVRRCLDSVAASTYRPLQLVIVDDGSEDATASEIASWLREHPGLDAISIRHPYPVGIGGVLNEAIEHCRGELLTGLAADDLLEPDGIGARVTWLLDHPEKLAVFADADTIDADGARLFDSAIEGHFRQFRLRKAELLCDALLPYALVFHFAMPGPVFMCRRAAYDVVGRYDESVVTDDWDMYLRLACIGQLGFLDRRVGSYRIHEQSMTRLHHERMVDDAARVARRLAGTFRGAMRLRLRAQHELWVARQSASAPGKALHWTRARALSALAHAGYAAKRWAVRRS
jgi:glycosyltransferase involved in cell wall biosynthesis